MTVWCLVRKWINFTYVAACAQASASFIRRRITLCEARIPHDTSIINTAEFYATERNFVTLLRLILLLFQDIMRNQKTKSQFSFTMILAQIVTVYLENHSKNQFHQTLELSPVVIIKDFWARITPLLYRLLSRSPRVSLVNLFYKCWVLKF